MSFLESLAKQVSEVSLYDVKSYIDKAKAVVMNYTEMEQKVHTATNDEPWGASSTLMQDIASGTFNFQLFNEIMPVIYSRFTEKEASQWRQIYKALQLLEYLIKHGSERVIDDARSHLSMIKMLRNFHYIDDKGKDQGINVRNRSKELAELLSDLERVRQERRKAKTNRNKYIGVGSDGVGGGDFGGSGSGLGSGGGGRYGGFGSESFNDHSMSSPSYPSSSYPSSGGGGGGGRSANRESFEEYDAGDDDDRTAAAPQSARGSSSRGSAAARAPAPIKKDTPVIAQQPAARHKEVNLFDFDDDEPLGGASASGPAQSAPAPLAANFDDDFDDFQGAPSASIAPAAAAPKPVPAPSSGGANFFDMMGSTAPAAPVSQPRTSQHMPAGPNYSNFGLFGDSGSGAGGRPGVSHTSSFPAAGVAPSRAPMQAQAQAGGMARPSSAKPAASSSAFDFDDLFAASGAKTSSAGQQKAGVAAAGNSSMASLAQQKAWGSMGESSSAAGAPAGNAGKSGFDDLLF